MKRNTQRASPDDTTTKSESEQAMIDNTNDKHRLAQLDALIVLHGWSKWLVGLDAGILGLLTFSLQDLDKAYFKTFPGMSLLFGVAGFALSLLVAAWLVGSLPGFTQQLKTNVQSSPLDWQKKPTIYEFKYAKIELRWYAGLQHGFFIVGVIGLAIGLCGKVLTS